MPSNPSVISVLKCALLVLREVGNSDVNPKSSKSLKAGHWLCFTRTDLEVPNDLCYMFPPVGAFIPCVPVQPVIIRYPNKLVSYHDCHITS